MDVPVDAISGHRPLGDGSPWRRAALIAGAVAAVELIALLVVALAFIAKPFAHSNAGTATHASSSAAATSASATHAGTTQAPKLAREKAAVRIPRGRTGVLVLNGNGEYGAASEKAIVVRGLDYPVVRIGDARHRDYPQTIVMYRQGFSGEGYRLARDLGLARSRVVPLDGLRPGDLSGAKLALVVGHKA